MEQTVKPTNGAGSAGSSVEPPYLPANADDDQLATFIAQEWAGKVRYFRGSWHVYENGVWVARDESEPRRNIRQTLKPYRQYLKSGIQQGRIRSVADMLLDDCHISDRALNAFESEAAKYVNLSNGLYNLEAGKLEEHSAGLYLTTQLDFAYDPAADCPHFKKFLRSSLATSEGVPDGDMELLVQEALAYSMTSRTDFKASFWLVGKPDAGKSTLVGFIRQLMGSLHTTIDLNQLATNRFLLSGIVGKRVVTFTEADQSSVLPDALYKAMVGGQDEIYVDVKNKPGFSFVPTAKFWWAMNGAPRVNDRSGATLNRLKLVLFDRTIPASERNPNLPALLHSERSGVFNWLLLGWQRLTATGKFTLPDRSAAWLEQYRIENDIEMMFVNEMLDFHPTFTVNGQDLYDKYRWWCDSNGYKPRNAANAAKEWRRLGLLDKRSNGRTNWWGARLRSA